MLGDLGEERVVDLGQPGTDLGERIGAGAAGEECLQLDPGRTGRGE
jgi:hypothetical protein